MVGKSFEWIESLLRKEKLVMAGHSDCKRDIFRRTMKDRVPDSCGFIRRLLSLDAGTVEAFYEVDNFV